MGQRNPLISGSELFLIVSAITSFILIALSIFDLSNKYTLDNLSITLSCFSIFFIVYFTICLMTLFSHWSNPDGTSAGLSETALFLVICLVLSFIFASIYQYIYSQLLNNIGYTIYSIISQTYMYNVLKILIASIALIGTPAFLVMRYAQYRRLIAAQQTAQKHVYHPVLSDKRSNITLSHMINDLVFLDRIWQYSYFRRFGQKCFIDYNELEHYYNLEDKLTLDICRDNLSLDIEETQKWLQTNAIFIVEYFNLNYKYGTLLQTIGGLKRFASADIIVTSFFNDLLLYIMMISSLIYFIYPILGFIGFIEPDLLLPNINRIYIILVCLLVIVILKYQPYTYYDGENLRRMAGDKIIQTPARIKLSNNTTDGLVKSIFFYALGSQIYKLYGQWEYMAIFIAIASLLIEWRIYGKHVVDFSK